MLATLRISSAASRPSFRSSYVGAMRMARRSFGHTRVTNIALPFPLAKSINNDGKVLRMLMFGKPGAGKGTLSTRLVQKYEILSLSTGDLLRQHIAEGTEVGRMAEGVVAAGGLLPDEVMLKVVTSKLDLLRDKHWILDGFPRTLGQGKLLDDHLRQRNNPLSLIVNLDVADDIILSRISDRWVHLPSGRVYNLSYNPPKVPGRDDETGEPLTKRPDDNPETFARRLEKFYASTSPLLSYFSNQPSRTTKLASLSGKTSDEIWPQLDGLIRTSFTNLKERSESREQRRRSSLSDAVLARSADQSIPDSSSWFRKS